MEEKFALPFTGDKDARLQQVKALAAEKGFEFVGDTRRGEFSGDTVLGRVSGTYSISGEKITVAITERPMLVSMTRIKNELAEFLG